MQVPVQQSSRCWQPPLSIAASLASLPASDAASGVASLPPSAAASAPAPTAQIAGPQKPLVHVPSQHTVPAVQGTPLSAQPAHSPALHAIGQHTLPHCAETLH